MSGELQLRSADIAVRLAPDRGADILGLTDLHTGSELLYRTPWADAAQPGPWAPDSRQAWQAGYPGGWQLLCPNAGDAGPVAGGTWGFHGEACLLRWTVHESAVDHAALSVRLSQAPLRIARRVDVSGPLLRVRDTFRNESPDPVAVAIVHHPAFGPPLVTPGARLAAGAPVADLATLPDGGPGRSALRYLTGFDAHWAAITSASGDLGVAMAWSGDVLPHAWLWFEGNATAELPWFRSEYIVAIEPASTIPATGVANADPAGLVRLEPGGAATTTVCLAVHHDPRPVTGMDPTGTITFQEESDEV